MFLAMTCLAALLAFPTPAEADSLLKKKEASEKRAEIDQMAEDALSELFSESSEAKQLYENAYGYAAFDNAKVALLISGGGGAGVAVRKGSGERTYMRMGTAGLNIGLGAQHYRVVFLFQTKEAFDRFVEKGWKAEANANIAAGKRGENATTTFENGVAVYQMTEAGLMAQVDISGTRYWKYHRLNER
jgi:lipid-binding SYLF domain-containing protein